MMANLTHDAETIADAWDNLGYSDDTWLIDAQRRLPPVTIPEVFSIHQAVLICYRINGCWYEGKVVQSRGSLYEVEFRAGGPRIRDWYVPSRGLIRPATADTREFLEALGFIVVKKAPNSHR